jgi:hypothetical protein
MEDVSGLRTGYIFGLKLALYRLQANLPTRLTNEQIAYIVANEQ